MSRKRTFEQVPARLRIERILQLIATRSLTAAEIRHALYMSETAMREYIRHLRDTRQIYIAGWTRDAVCGLRPMLRPKYRAGQRVDAPRPPAKPAAISNREYRQRVMDNPERYARAYNTIRMNDARSANRRRGERIRRLAAAGYGDATTLGMMQGRILIGERVKSPTPQQIAEIIRLRDAGTTWRRIAESVGVSEITARKYYARIAG